MPSNRSPTSNPLPVKCNMVVVTHRIRKMYWCTIVHEPHVLERSAGNSCSYPGEVGNLHACRFLQPDHCASNSHIRLATPLVWLIFFPTATIIAIFTD
ncbi:hypothetical protein TNCV_3957321 [Trichonephila clavipes]|nr:hypothetical protein TNCV_3957321 [Trichonephila clavipes]